MKKTLKKTLSIILAILMVVTMLPIAIMPASAAYDYDETAKISFKITNLVREWKGETEELGEYGSAFYEQSLTKVADGKYKYTYKAALSSGGGTWWSDPKTVTFDGVNCESDYYKTFDFTESTSSGGYTMTWTYTLEVKRYKGHTYGAWSDNGDGTHTRTCVINSAHKETASHNYAAATCSAPETCKNCGVTQGEPVADAHSWNAATCVLPQTCKYCGITQGEVLGHNMVAATFGKPAACSRCGATDINISVLEAALINTNVNLPSKAVKDDNAGYNDITWSVVDAGSTGATINGSTLKASYSGEAVIRAIIESDSKDFTILFKSSENIDISLGSVTVSKKDDSTLTVAYAGFEGGSKDYMVGEPIQITGTTTSNYVEVSSGSATVILNNVSISRNEYCFRVNGGATANLTLVGSNALSTGQLNYAALSVPENATVIIDGEGTLTTASSKESAAIGSGYRDNGTGTIVINGGTIIAKNTDNTGNGGAGIGGGNQKNGGNITINGGVVTATGGDDAAGIGGGSYGDGGQITINGGVVTATGGESAPGIGGGYHGNGGQITITGGTVIAKGGVYRDYYSGAGIGGGSYGDGGTVVITGGNIKATAGSSSAEAIGKGYKGESSGTIKDGNGNDLSLQTITLSGTAANTAVTATDGITYGLTDVKTVDTNKLYFYLPADTAATSITAGGTVYDCVVGLTYYPGHSYLEATCSTAKTCTTCGLTEGEALGHNMVDGICIVCRLDENDVLHIYTANQLMDFAVIVNEGYKDADAILEADIDLDGYTWTPIGVTAMGEGVTNGYTGNFDGNGHVIRNVTFATPVSAMAAGIFGTVQSGGTVRNLGVENLSFDDNTYDHRAGGIAGQLLADSTISDCYVSNSTVKASSRVVGGIVGMNNGTVKNCYTCNMSLAGYNNRFGGISGDFSAGKLENCYTDYFALASSQAGTATNCKAGVSADVFASGEIAYLLNGSTSEGDLVWGQLIGTDSYPVFDGETVYYNETNGYYNILHTCDFSGEWKYDADKHWKECTVDGCDKISEDAEHSFTDGKCDNGCGAEVVTLGGNVYPVDGDITNTGIHIGAFAAFDNCYKAGDGYILIKGEGNNDTVMTLYNATIDVRGTGHKDAIRVDGEDIEIRFIGENNIFADEEAYTTAIGSNRHSQTFIGADDAVLNLYGNVSLSDINIESGTVNVYGADVNDIESVYVEGYLVISEGAVLNIISGDNGQGFNCGIIAQKEIVAEGEFNAIALTGVETDNEIIYNLTAIGNAVLGADTYNPYYGMEIPEDFNVEFNFIVPEGTSVTVPEGITLNLDSMTNVDIDGELIVYGTLICTHTGGENTCDAPAVCDICKQVYGEKLTHTDEDGDYICDHGCGYEYEKPAEPTEDTICEDCGKVHDGFFAELICFFTRIINFIKNLFA